MQAEAPRSARLVVAKAADAPSPAPAPAPGKPAPTPNKPADDEEAKKKAEANKKANALSRNMFLGAVAGSGALTWTFRTLAPAPVFAAFNPSIQAVFDAAKAPGARFNEGWTNKLTAFTFRLVKADAKNGSEQVDHGPSKLIYPALREELISIYMRRSAKDNRVTAQTDTVVTYATQLELVCSGVKERLLDNDIQGAARRLAGLFVHDHAVWYEYSPRRKYELQVIALRAYPYFRRLDDAQRTALIEATKTEVARIAGKDEKAAEYSEQMLKAFITDPASIRKQQTDVSKFAEPSVMEDMAMEMLAISSANTDGRGENIKSMIEKKFAELYKGKGIFARLGATRARKRVAKAVTSELEAFERGAGRPAKLEEIMRMVLQAIELDQAGALERRVTWISGGAFAAMGVVTGLATMGINAALGNPAVKAAANPVIYALVGYAMGASGSFINTKFSSWSRSLGFRALKKPESIGPRNERDLLNQLLATLAVDGRYGGVRAALCMYQMGLNNAVIDAEAAIRDNNLEGAAEFLAGAVAYGATMFAEFSPHGKLMELTYKKLGPYFDCLTAQQRDELTARVLERCKAALNDDQLVSGYCDAAITKLLTTNVNVKA